MALKQGSKTDEMENKEEDNFASVTRTDPV